MPASVPSTCSRSLSHGDLDPAGKAPLSTAAVPSAAVLLCAVYVLISQEDQPTAACTADGRAGAQSNKSRCGVKQ